MALPNPSTPYLFFTGKGGVGKTSLSCATGLALADAGRRVLIVSTDPASNLDAVLGIGLAQTPTAIPGVPGLFALNIDPEAAAHAYRERMVGPYRGILPAAAIQSMEEQFSGACTVEIAAFDEFSKLLGDPAATADFDQVIFDTAPTGHTLRLLTLPSAWHQFIASTTGGASCLGPLAGLKKQKALYAATVQRLTNPAETTVILVSRPETSALREAERTRGELAELGIQNLQLAIRSCKCCSVTVLENHMKTLEIDWRHLDKDGRTGLRCSDTLQSLQQVIQQLAAECAPHGVEIGWIGCNAGLTGSPIQAVYVMDG